ncbi:MAG: glycosyltransferase [Chitinivibrionales bacterium]|nr:glycosyltransferase [Chitinivibrionales bacterium]
MKILVTLDFPPEKGGIQRHLFEIVRHTYSHNDYVLAGCSHPPRQIPDEIECRLQYISFPLVPLPKKAAIIPMLYHMYRLLKISRRQPDIECGNCYAGFVPWLLSFFVPLKYMLYIHGTDLYSINTSFFKGRVLKSILKKACAVVANSNFTRSLAIQYGYDGPLSVLYPKLTVSPEEICCRAKNKLQSGNTVTILTVGRLVAEKGHAVLISAAALITNEVDIRLVLVGDGPEKNRLKKLCSKHGIQNRVVFKHELPDIELSKEYSYADIFVLPSLPTKKGIEGFGIVLLEAMSYGTAIVASECGGIPEVISDSGVLVEPGDASLLAEALTKIARDSALRKSLAEKAVARVTKHYVWKK